MFAAYASLKRIQTFLLLDEKSEIGGEEEAEKQQSCIHLQGSFAWAKKSNPVLFDIEVQIPVNQLTVCVGPVAAVSPLILLAVRNWNCLL
jgi:hypothetical protein